jgi:hypothetical protein
MLRDEAYKDLFVDIKLGENVLNELVGLFYDCPSYTRGDTHETAYKEGQRNVIEFILRKLSQVQLEEEGE